MIYPYVLLHPVLSRTLGKHFKENCLLQKSDKGKIFYWSSQTCTRVSRLFGWLVVTIRKKTQNCPITPKYFLPFTDLVPASTDPVPPSTNQYRPILTQYHHVSTITAFYWPISTKYQPVPPYTNPVSPSINHYRPILIPYHQVPTNIAPYWPSTIKYQPVSPSIDLVPPSINHYRPILICTNKYQ